MNRINIIQKIIDKKMARTYLEIGTASGNSFFPIKARRKIAIDPNFTFSKISKIKWIFKNFCNIRAKYYRLSSDNYYRNVKLSHRLDVVFIDGLHTYQQSLKDVINSLSNLKENGVIVMHDCNPPHRASAYPADSYNHAASLNISGWTGEWCGDVWKTICYLRSFRKDLNVFVLNCDYGLGIITKRKPENNLNFTEEELNKLTYDDLEKNREELLNLKPIEFLDRFLNSL
ncbi:MAG: hypothetical protein B5M48_01195 [Candidatus Omnitrophica bacterium 4484_213]|nr:MAG: hypothetical protein B5M48_01195 [Candidatus Omnitrophica bacterium 4484_213]